MATPAGTSREPAACVPKAANTLPSGASAPIAPTLMLLATGNASCRSTCSGPVADGAGTVTACWLWLELAAADGAELAGLVPAAESECPDEQAATTRATVPITTPVCSFRIRPL